MCICGLRTDREVLSSDADDLLGEGPWQRLVFVILRAGGFSLASSNKKTLKD
jgi:hypothetical protein